MTQHGYDQCIKQSALQAHIYDVQLEAQRVCKSKTISVACTTEANLWPQLKGQSELPYDNSYSACLEKVKWVRQAMWEKTL